LNSTRAKAGLSLADVWTPLEHCHVDRRYDQYTCSPICRSSYHPTPRCRCNIVPQIYDYYWVDIGVAPQQRTRELESIVTAAEKLGNTPSSIAGFDFPKATHRILRGRSAREQHVKLSCGTFVDSFRLTHKILRVATWSLWLSTLPPTAQYSGDASFLTRKGER
jgi:hypothetical protein